MKKSGFRLAVVLAALYAAAITGGPNSRWESRPDELDKTEADEGFLPLFDGK